MKDNKKLRGLCKSCAHCNSCKDAKRNLNMVKCSEHKNMADITVDQLIADLCIARGKNPDIGIWRLVQSKVIEDNFYLEITDGKDSMTFAIEMPEKELPSHKQQIEIGDEVQCYNKKGEPLSDAQFIVTYTDADSIHGIDFAGKPYIYSSDADLRKTGRHYDIIDTLKMLRR